MDDYRNMHDQRLTAGDWTRRILRYWPQTVTIIASFASIITLIISVINIKDSSVLAQIYVYQLSAFSLFLFAFLVFQEYRYSRKARYAEATYNIHNCIHFLRDYHFDFDNIQRNVDCKWALSKVTTALANAFSLVTGTHCRTCIKTLEIRHIKQDEFQAIDDKHERATYLFVNTFCRDNVSATTKSTTDGDSYIHPIIGNTDFHELYLHANKRIFFANDLFSYEYKGLYQNTSTQGRQKLPYRSTIVWPIRKLTYEQDCGAQKLSTQEQDIIGFLCVDSARKNVFRKDYDLEIGAIVADALFIFLKSYHRYLQTASKNVKMSSR